MKELSRHDLSLEPLCYDLLHLDCAENIFPKSSKDGQPQFDLQKCQDSMWEKIRNEPFFNVYNLLSVKEQISNVQNQNILKKDILRKLELVKFVEHLEDKWLPLFTTGNFETKQLNEFQIEVNAQKVRLKLAEEENEFPKHKRFIKKLLNKLLAFKEFIDLIKLKISAKNCVEDENPRINEVVNDLKEVMADLIDYAKKIQFARRFVDKEIIDLLEITKKLPKLIRSKKLLELYQTMLLDIYKAVESRKYFKIFKISRNSNFAVHTKPYH